MKQLLQVATLSFLRHQNQFMPFLNISDKVSSLSLSHLKLYMYLIAFYGRTIIIAISADKEH